MESSYLEYGSKLPSADPYLRAQVRIWVDFGTTRVIISFYHFFLGRSTSLVDCVVALWAVRLWVFDHYNGGFQLSLKSEEGVDETSWNRWRQLLTAVEKRRSIKETIIENKCYFSIC